MSAVTLLASVVADSGTGASVDLGAATALRLTWTFSFSAPANFDGIQFELQQSSSPGGPWRNLRTTPNAIGAVGTFRMSVGGADQFVRCRWDTHNIGGVSSGCTVACSGEALP